MAHLIMKLGGKLILNQPGANLKASSINPKKQRMIMKRLISLLLKEMFDRPLLGNQFHFGDLHLSLFYLIHPLKQLIRESKVLLGLVEIQLIGMGIN